MNQSLSPWSNSLVQPKPGFCTEENASEWFATVSKDSDTKSRAFALSTLLSFMKSKPWVIWRMGGTLPWAASAERVARKLIHLHYHSSRTFLVVRPPWVILEIKEEMDDETISRLLFNANMQHCEFQKLQFPPLVLYPSSPRRAKRDKALESWLDLTWRSPGHMPLTSRLNNAAAERKR